MIIIGSDHAGYEFKLKFIEYLKSKNIEYKDVGCFSAEPFDYPLIGFKMGEEIIKNNCYGIGICGSGIGISIALNKVKGIRAVNCSCEDHAKLSRMHNNANCICFGARLVKFEDSIKWFEIFNSTKFEEGHHSQRVKELDGK